MDETELAERQAAQLAELERKDVWQMNINGTKVTMYLRQGQDFIEIGRYEFLPASDAIIMCRAILGALGERQ